MKERRTVCGQKGFSLIELMIALLIGLILVGGIIQVFLGSKVTYSTQAALSKVQENGRFAMSFLTRDIRQAGYTGCSRNTSTANTIRNASNAIPSFLDLSDPVNGLDNMNGTDTFNETPIAGTDVIEVKFADPTSACSVDKHVPISANLHCDADHNFQKGEILIVTDCEHTAVFQFAKAGTSNKIVVHGSGASVSPGNCTKGLGAPVACTANGTSYQYSSGSVMRMAAYRYYVSDTGSFNQPALYREVISNSSGTFAIQAQELVEGIENLQILYGEDTNNDGSADYYVPFGDVASSDSVVSVRVSILVRSIEANIVQGSQTLQFNGSSLTFNDGRLRKAFTSTIALRNRL